MIDPVLLGAALIPILGLMIALGVFRAPAHVAAPAALAVGALLAAALWGMDALGLATAALEGMATAIWPIVLVIFAALFTFKLAESTGSLDTIKRMLSSITTDRRFQVLILVWGFGGFLEGVAGYGTAVAIPASLLVATGFDPLFAAFIALLANTVPTAFGAVGIPVTTLAAVAGYPAAPVSLAVAIQLSPLIVIIPFLLVVVTGGGFRALKGATLVTLGSGVAFVVPQLLAAAFLGTELPTILGSLASLAVTIALARRQGRREVGGSPGGWGTTRRQDGGSQGVRGGDKPPDGQGLAALHPDKMEIGIIAGVLAWLPYILVFFIILITSPLVPPLHGILDSVKTTVTIYSGPGATASVFKWILTPGVLIMAATLIAGFAQGARPAMIASSLTTTARKLLPSTVTIISILALAKIMAYAGMIGVIAHALAAATGGLYPLFSPIIGALGTFVTGSDTTSNILFGKLQTGVASAIGRNPIWLAAANTAGATAGKMISPQSITVAVTAIGMQGREGALLRRTLPWCLLYVAALGSIVYFGFPLSP